MGRGSHGPGRPTRRDVEEELRFHLEERAREYEAHGMSPNEAAAAARAAFGDVRRIEDELLREAGLRSAGHGSPSGPGAWSEDVRAGLRALRRSPRFTLGVALLLATGIGATTAVFAVVDAVVIRPLPYPDPDRLVELEQGAHSPADFVIWTGSPIDLRSRVLRVAVDGQFVTQGPQ